MKKTILLVLFLLSCSHAQVDIRTFGAACNGTDQNSAVQLALSLGNKWILIPRNCLWVVPGGNIPGGLTVQGEDAQTSTIKTAGQMKAGSGARLINVNVLSASTSATNAPTAYYVNSSDTTQVVVTTPGGSSFTSIGGVKGIDNTPVYFQVVAGNGDALNASSGTTGKGGGNAARFDVYPSGTGAVYIGRHSSAVGVGLSDLPNTGGSGSGATGARFNIFSNIGTSGEMFSVNQRDSTFTGTVYDASMADISGSFTGYFASWKKSGAVKFSVKHDGTTTIAALMLNAPNSEPSSASAYGLPGEVRFTANYIYFCVAQNTWKRAALTTW